MLTPGTTPAAASRLGTTRGRHPAAGAHGLRRRVRDAGILAMQEDTPRYEAIPEFTREEVAAALDRDDPGVLLYAALSAALHDPDASWATGIALRLASHPHGNVRGNALTALGHIARLHGWLPRQAAQAALVAGLADPEDWVRRHADDAIDDVEHFLGWRIRERPAQLAARAAGRPGMTGRRQGRWLQGLAGAVGPLCFAAAGVLYFAVTWVPDALVKRNLMLLSLLVAGCGSSVATVGADVRRLRLAGAATLLVGLLAFVVVGLW
jgi:hypothetical protein